MAHKVVDVEGVFTEVIGRVRDRDQLSDKIGQLCNYYSRKIDAKSIVGCKVLVASLRDAITILTIILSLSKSTR